MADLEININSELQPGDRIILNYQPDIQPTTTTTTLQPIGKIDYHVPDASQIKADLPALPEIWHDKTLYHGLAVGVHVDNEYMGVFRADHEHGEVYPQWALDLFGDYRTYTGQGVSYPWQTGLPDTPENQYKHNGYKFGGHDYRHLNFEPRVQNTNVVDAWWIQVHMMGTTQAALGRIHSFFGMALVRNPATGQSGIIISGGHSDLGQLVIPYKAGDDAIVPLANTPQPAYFNETPPYRGHSTTSPTDDGNTTWNSVYRSGSLPSITPHAFFRHAWRQTRVHVYATGGLNTPDPTFAYYSGGDIYNPQTMYNSSKRNPYQIEITVPAMMDENNDGVVNFEGFTDVNGNVIEANEAGPNAIPLRLINCPVGNALTNFAGENGPPFALANMFDGDFYFDTDGNLVNRDAPGARPAGWIGDTN